MPKRDEIEEETPEETTEDVLEDLFRPEPAPPVEVRKGKTWKRPDGGGRLVAE